MLKILVFAFDIAEAAQIRRIRSFRAAGFEVASASMRRANMNRDFVPDWPDIHLFVTENENPVKRIATILGAIAKMVRHRDAVARADILVARNFDMLAIAWASRLMQRQGRPRLVYECLDIHGLFTRGDFVGRVMRMAERFLLRRADLLVTSSPGFVREYFAPVQKYRGPVAIIENKLWFDGEAIPRPVAPRRRREGEPLVLGWIGSIRCAPSLDLLMAAADRLGERIRIEIHGAVHHHAVPGFEEAVAARPNVTWFGPYRYPDGLAGVYARCDLVWAQDLWQRGANSDWLLPNRIYEASWFGCPSIAVADTETGRRVHADGLGFVIGRAEAGDLVALLAGLDPGAVTACAERLLRRDEGDFRLTVAEVRDAFLSLPAARPDAAGERSPAAG